MKDDYSENYERIARDHVEHWRQTGVNPWQSDEHVAAVTAVTVDFIRRYSQPGDPVLDAGCGMGDLLLQLPDLDGQGVDFSPEYVSICKERGLAVTQAELESLPFEDGTFALVVAADVLEHVLDLNAVVREMLRVLRPDGVLVVRSPDSEDLTPYLDPHYPYRFAHLRRFDEPGLRLLLDRVFECEVLEVQPVLGTGPEIVVAARRRA